MSSDELEAIEDEAYRARLEAIASRAGPPPSNDVVVDPDAPPSPNIEHPK